MKSVDPYPVPSVYLRDSEKKDKVMVDALVVIRAAGERLSVINQFRATIHRQTQH